MSQIVDDLRQVAIEIKTETQVGGNTAARVGGAFERVADALEGTQQIEDMDAAVAAVQQAAQENEQTIQNIVNSLAVVQTTGQSTSSVMSQKAVTDELNDINIKTANDANTDLDIADERGNVLVRFSEGGIKVKNFNSANAVSEGDTPWQTDLDITDEDNNSLVEFANGHLRTRNFDSRFVLQSKWRYKKIAWYGTSIPAGYPNQNNQDVYAYPNIIASILGATIFNKCVPNGVVRSTRYDGTPLSGNRTNLSFTKTTSAINYQNSMLDLIGTPDEPDLFVFDYGVNDIGEDATELNEQLDFSYLGTNTFFGALSFVLYNLYNAKPKARVIVLTHYSDDGIQTNFYGKDVWKPMNDAIENFAKYWGVKLINAREFVGWHNTKPNVNAGGSNNMSVYVIDGIHPASGNNVDAVNLLADLYLPYINNFK